MTRKVIFVPDDYWTNPPKENPMTNHAATDCRRASALVVHYGTEQHDGVNEVLKESTESGRATEFIIAVLQLFQNVVPQLVTELGMACLSDTILRLAKDEDADPDCRRAAQLIAHHGNANVSGINTVLSHACEADRVTPLILAVLHLYSITVPAVFTALGLSALQRSVLDFAALEDQS